MSGARHWEQDKEATVYIGNLDERVTDSLVWELMLQAGRIVNVHLPKDRVTQTHQGYGFVEFISEEDAEYAARIMNQVRLYGKPIRVNKASADKQKTVEVGAELFVGNLDPMVTEQVLYDTFSRFGSLISIPKIARDDANLSKGYGFVSFSNFEASDDAIANMNGQYLMNKEISVQYAYKKDGKGERHGDQAERMLAAQARKHNVQPQTQPLPPQLLSGGPPIAPAAMADGEAARPMDGPPGFGAGRGAIANGGYPNAPPHAQQPQSQPHHAQQQQSRPFPPQHQLTTPPPGLPARPPPSQAGYGGPQAFVPPGFSGQPPSGGFAAGGPPGAPGQGPAPPGGPPQGAPPGFGSPAGFGPPAGGPGAPPQLPPGFQQAGYGRGR
ncbi:hypothetical protein FQN54_001913 [Arachnomyces sp. PD_36]|nr:hypothetical protein FQN54_001913 [Arachnomyces sp. PD_36]